MGRAVDVGFTRLEGAEDVGFRSVLSPYQEKKTMNNSNVPLVFGFHAPHRIGSVCGFPCEQCGGEMELTGLRGKKIEPIPFFIVAEATKEDWKRSVKANGGSIFSESKAEYFYVVHCD